MGICWASPSNNQSSTTTGQLSTSVGISHTTTNTTSSDGSTISGNSRFSVASGSDDAYPNGQILPIPNLRIFSFLELKNATKSFRTDTVLGEGGFGKVYKGWLDEKVTSKSSSGSVVAVKKLNSQSVQGFQEWQSEVNFLGRLSHPNLVKLLGYCWEDKELLLVYEFMQKGSLENHLFGRGSAVQPLPWDIRLKILIGAARGLAFLHTSEKHVIYRDFKASNILLDGSYNAKISDFGLAKLGPSESQSHVTTRVMGTYGYAAPEYVATGHLYVKSDVYGFGVVLVEMLTALRAIDTNRPTGQHNLGDWVKPYLADRRKLKNIMDSRLEGKYPSKAAQQIAQLALKCLGPEPKTRPSMKEVVETLERIDSNNEKTKEPRIKSAHRTAYQHGKQPLHHRSQHHLRQDGNQSYQLPQRAGQRDLKTYWPLYDCPQCIAIKEQGHMKSASGSNPPDEKDIDIIVTYSDTSGSVRIRTVKSRDLSASWVWRRPTDENIDRPKSSQTLEESFQADMRFEDDADHSTDEHQSGGEMPQPQASTINPVKLKRRMLRQRRRDLRTAELIRQDKEIDNQMQAAAIERAKELDTTVKGKYSIWRKEHGNPNSDSTLKLMRDQIIMAKLYASIAKAKNESGLCDSLIKHSRANHYAIGDASSDAELQPSALDHAKAMGHILSIAKDQFYDCLTVTRKLRAMLQSTELNVNLLRKKSAFLIQLAAKVVPKPLHCLPLQLTTDYYLQSYENKGFPNKDKLEDTSLYHYALFSDNVLAASVVVNSTVLHAKDPEKHVFHIVTDKLNFAAMKMWFLVYPPAGAAIQVEKVDDFTWLNSSYCPVLRQLESARMKEYYFKANQVSSLSVGSDNLKYRNPKYLSMLNHLRFYLPEVYPKLDKILFLDDDIVVQKDLTPLWSVNLEGMVNGAVETCKESFHRFDKYLNFSNPKISDNFDANACGWAFGMNIFDLKEWRKQDITGIYHRWQNMNEDRTLWKLGTLPPGLITFYRLTYPLERSWHVLGLGYDPALNKTEIENAAVIHYNGNNKPWLDLAISKYKSYWSRYVMFDNSYLRACKINE